jgi:cytochrome c oxidase subunit 3
MSDHHTSSYYLPSPSYWPIIGSIALFSIMFGGINWLHGVPFGHYLFALGLAILFFMMFGWFSTVVKESGRGYYDKQVDRSFRWGMSWFIFSEIMFFSAFFGALFYARVWGVPWLAGEKGYDTNVYLIWQNFKDVWPVFHNPNPDLFVGPQSVMYTWGIPALNTLILLTSGVTITIAHWGLLKNNRKQLIIGMALTVALGILFLYCQAHEYMEAYTDKGLKISSGIYGTTFFSLTGFHGLHVTIGTIMLIVILVRCCFGHFDKEHHFAFEAVSWYWHFVDVVWLFLFIFVYWL